MGAPPTLETGFHRYASRNTSCSMLAYSSSPVKVRPSGRLQIDADQEPVVRDLDALSRDLRRHPRIVGRCDVQDLLACGPVPQRPGDVGPPVGAGGDIAGDGGAGRVCVEGQVHPRHRAPVGVGHLHHDGLGQFGAQRGALQVPPRSRTGSRGRWGRRGGWDPRDRKDRRDRRDRWAGGCRCPARAFRWGWGEDRRPLRNNPTARRGGSTGGGTWAFSSFCGGFAPPHTHSVGLLRARGPFCVFLARCQGTLLAPRGHDRQGFARSQMLP